MTGCFQAEKIRPVISQPDNTLGLLKAGFAQLAFRARHMPRTRCDEQKQR